MKMKILAAAAFAAACTFGQAQAATLLANSTDSATVSDSWIEFDDSNGDSLLQFAEVTSWSGMTVYGVYHGFLTSVPTIPMISDHDGGAEGQVCGNACGTSWYVSTIDDGSWDLGVPSRLLTYEITGLAPVPIPASLPLLAFGLGGLGLMARRKRKVS